MKLSDQIFEAMIDLLMWPLDKAQGGSVFVRLIAVAFGLLWIVPIVLLVVCPVLILAVAPLMIWEELR